MTQPLKYQTKPTPIEAMQMPFEPTDAEALEIYQWVESYIGSVAPDSGKCGVTIHPSGLIHIKSLSEEKLVRLGHWVIRSPLTGFSVKGPGVFENKYEPQEVEPLIDLRLHDTIYNRENLY
jgi:hypothetical protein